MNLFQALNRRLEAARARARLAKWLTWVVVGSHLVLLTVFFTDRYEPGLIHIPEMWAMDRRWQFYLLVIVVCGGGAVSVFAWWLRRAVRFPLVLTWAVFAGLLYYYDYDRVTAMAQLIWQQQQ